MKPIKLSTWKIKLPMFPPDEVTDDSTNSEYTRCPRRGLYRYGLRRGFEGVNFPIQFGLAYHKYRELIEETDELTDDVHDAAQATALEGFIQPPAEHKHSHNDMARVVQSFQLAKERVIREREQGKIIVEQSEDSFDLELPLFLCKSCGHTELIDSIAHKFEKSMPNGICRECNTDQFGKVIDEERLMIRARHGGRVDQFIRLISLSNGEFVRDFKTTGQMGPYYDLKFEPNSQMQGYVWSKEELSGKKCDGVLIETLYNTKTKGPEIHQTYKSFSQGQQESWVASVMMERQMIQLMWSRVEELGYLAFPQRTHACNDFGGCGYREACLAGGAFEIEQWLEGYTVESHWDFTNPDGGKE